MRWSAPADKAVVEAVIATFCDSAEHACERLSTLRHRDWERTYQWLDASGMALYFLNQVQTFGIENVLPAATLGRLRQNLADNRRRSAFMLAEFISINRGFLQAGVKYCNLKGFTLSPGYCPSPALRCQLDFDFLVDGHQLELCQRILAETGYVLTAATKTVWEFKADSSELTRIEDHYKPRPQRAVELHFACSATTPEEPSCDERLDRLAQRTWNDHSFPTLSASDQFVGQALHLFSHLRGSCTRLSWLLEYKRYVSARYEDQPFWEEVRRRSDTHRQAFLAIGLATELSTQLFGGRAPAQLNEWTLDRLPVPIRLWADCYGRKAVLAGFPGTKLYLLLEDELARNDNSWQKKRLRKLLPLHRVPRISCSSPNESWWKGLRREFYQARFIFFRLRFHIVEGLRFATEARRWRRYLAAQPSYVLNSRTEKTCLSKGYES
jgi:hypothetical protein